MADQNSVTLITMIHQLSDLLKDVASKAGKKLSVDSAWLKAGCFSFINSGKVKWQTYLENKN